MLIHNSIPITLHDNLLTFRDIGKIFDLKADLLKMIPNNKLNVNLASLLDEKVMYDFAKEMNLDVKGPGNKSIPDRILIKLLKSPTLMASGISEIVLPSDLDELCVLIKFLMQEIQTGNNSDITNEEIIAVVDKIIEDKCVSKKKHKQNLMECNLLHKKKK